MRHRRTGLTMLEVVIATIILAAVVTMMMVMMSSASNQTTNESAGMVMQEKATKLLEEIAAELRMAKAASISPIAGSEVSNATFLDATNDNAVTPVNPVGGPPFNATVPDRARSPINSNSTKAAVLPGHTRYGGISFDTMPTDSMKVSAGTPVPVNDFDFATKTPVYSRTVVYQSAGEAGDYQGGALETLDNGKDDNQNGLIDERILQRREFKNNPPPATLPTFTPVARNIRGIAFEIPTPPAIPERVILHVMFQDVDSKGKVMWFYTTTTVAVRN